MTRSLSLRELQRLICRSHPRHCAGVHAAHGVSPHLTRFDAALPFLVAAVLIVAGVVAAALVVDRVEALFHRWALDAEVDETDLPYTFRPEAIAAVSKWTIDAAQILAGLLAPLVGLVLLQKHGISSGLALVYLVMFVLDLAAFALFLKRDPTFYGGKSPPLLTPIVALCIFVSLACAAAAYAIGP